MKSIITLLLALQCTLSIAQDNVLFNSGWKIECDPANGTLNISNVNLGILLKDLKIASNNGNSIVPVRSLSVSKKGTTRLVINTTGPLSSWLFEIDENKLNISSTLTSMCLTGTAPAGKERIVARLIDTDGFPVTWEGTAEIRVSFNGKQTRNRSYLPVKNPDVMTFSLGQVSALNLHSLFDRKTDIAIDFPEKTIMKRDTGNPDILNIVIPVPGNSAIELIPDYYTKVLGVPFYSRFDDSYFKTAPVVWGSWTAYYNFAREEDIVKNTDWISANLKPYGFSYVQLDDGYDRHNPEGHYWIDKWSTELFPHGPEWLAGYIKSKGLRPGIWLVPNSYAGFYKDHPEWYVHDHNGKPILDYVTPALDQTNPATMEWLKKLFSTLRGWGFEYYKFDGEFSIPEYAVEADRSKLFDPSRDQVEVYRERLKLIRDVVGPETFIEGCVAGTPINGIGYFNSVFNGADVYNSFKGSYAMWSSINANAFLNHMVVYVMPGEGIDVSPVMTPEQAGDKMVARAINVAKSREDPFTGFGSTDAQARTQVTITSLSGVTYPLTSIMYTLPEERVQLLKKTMPTLPIMPVDLFSRGTDLVWEQFKLTTPDEYIHNYQEILNLKINSVAGKYDVAALTNWRSEPVSREISFTDKLGLEDREYVVFDFWEQKILGVFKGSIRADIEPYDTRVFWIRPKESGPLLAGNSRHISGTYSISALNYDKQAKSISGISEVIAGDPYSSFFYMPDGVKFKKVTAAVNGNPLKPLTSVERNSLIITFQADGDVEWKVEFLR